MLWLYMLLGVLALLLFLLFVNVKFRISYDKDVVVKLSVLGIRFPLYPKKKKKIRLRDFSYKKHQKRLLTEERRAEKKRLKKLLKEQRKKDKKTVKKKKDALPSYGKEVSDEPPFLQTLLSVIGGILDKFAGMIRIDVVRLHITVGGKDAATTALTYGVVSQSISYLLEILKNKTKPHRRTKESVAVSADFLLETTKADVSVILTLKPWHLVNIAFTAIFRFFKEKFRTQVRKI